MGQTLFIGGKWMPAATGTEFDTLDPATGQPHARCADAGPLDVDNAVTAARAALESPAWAGLAPGRTRPFLWRIGDLIEEHAEELAELETRDQGQPLGISRNVSVAAAASTSATTPAGSPRSTARRHRLSFPNVLHTRSASRSASARSSRRGTSR